MTNRNPDRKPIVRPLAAALIVAASLSAAAPSARAAITGPYTADANTLHLYHFDEASGVSDPGNPFLDTGNGTTANLTDTGGPDGRDNTGAGGYGAAAYSGFGSSFNAPLTGTGTHHGGGGGPSNGGGATTGAGVAQSNFQAANGAYTWEAIVFTGALAASPTVTNEYTILSHDGGLNAENTRGPMLRVVVATNGTRTLNWFNGQGGATTMTAALPTTGDHAFAAGEWFHVAATYTGEAGAGNFTLYWTALDSGATEANLLASLTQTADALANSNYFGVGVITRSPYRHEWDGLIDEVRISDIARGAGDFIFAPAAGIPTPTSAAAAALGLTMLTVRRHRRRHR